MIGLLTDCFFALSVTIAGHTVSPTSFEHEVLVRAFRASHQGYSSDELLVRDELLEAFLGQVEMQLQRELSEAEQREAVLSLLRLRKSGRLGVKTTKRARGVGGSSSIGEIAARVVCDRHRVSLDYLFADPNLRRAFNSEARLIAADVELEQARRSALGLRKKRALKPELVLRVAEWNRTIQTMTVQQARIALDEKSISDGPGIYLFRDESGYLYIGEAKNIYDRIGEHLSGSDRASLAQYLAEKSGPDITLELHLFDKQSPASSVSMRRAYESELIRSRNPKFNVRP
ncbi:MAG: GIY-YIG nuclease family protein [Planctomycetota bacterium]